MLCVYNTIGQQTQYLRGATYHQTHQECHRSFCFHHQDFVKLYISRSSIGAKLIWYFNIFIHRIILNPHYVPLSVAFVTSHFPRLRMSSLTLCFSGKEHVLLWKFLTNFSKLRPPVHLRVLYVFDYLEWLAQRFSSGEVPAQCPKRNAREWKVLVSMRGMTGVFLETVFSHG